jgi:hypothetical protein
LFTGNGVTNQTCNFGMVLLSIWLSTALMCPQSLQATDAMGEKESEQCTVGQLLSTCVADASMISSVVIAGKVDRASSDVEITMLSFHSELTAGQITQSNEYTYLVSGPCRTIPIWPDPSHLPRVDEPYVPAKRLKDLRLSVASLRTLVRSCPLFEQGQFVAMLRSSELIEWMVAYSSVLPREALSRGEVTIEILEPSLEATISQPRKRSQRIFGSDPPLLEYTTPMSAEELMNARRIEYFPVMTVDLNTGATSGGEVVVVGNSPTTGATTIYRTRPGLLGTFATRRGIAVSAALIFCVVFSILVLISRRSRGPGEGGE